MNRSRQFPTAVVASLSTGILLCKFNDMHEAAEFMLGHPIWTHHFANKELWEKMRTAVLKQYPDMPIVLDGVTKENYKEHVIVLEAKFGPSVLMHAGDDHTAMSPFDGLAEVSRASHYS